MSGSLTNGGILQQNITVTFTLPTLLLSLAVAALTLAIVVTLLGRHNDSITQRMQMPQDDEISTAKPPKSQGSKRPTEPGATLAKHQSRFQEETRKQKSSEYTGRGQIWSQHAAWHLSMAPRDTFAVSKSHARGMEPIRAILNKYGINMATGFLPAEEPLQRLPYARYHVWEDLGDDLPKLLGARLGQARGPLQQLPVLATDKLTTDAELRRAHLLLCLFAHSYVFGGTEPLDVLPKGIAIPLCEVSEKLGIPPVLSHPSIVLYNWRKLDSDAAICMENLSTLNNFFDGRDESWFYLITVEVEAKGARAIVPTLLAIDAITRYNEEQLNCVTTSDADEGQPNVCVDILDTTSHSSSLVESDGDGGSEEAASSDDEAESLASDRNAPAVTAVRYEALLGQLTVERVALYVTRQLRRIAGAIEAMGTTIGAMREGCHPFIFYHRVRPFLSGWKHNPTLPHGVLYSGVDTQRRQYYGGSAAQSALLPLLDIGLGVQHDSVKSTDFLLAMRDYMLKPHRELLAYLEEVANIREFVSNLKSTYLYSTADVPVRITSSTPASTCTVANSQDIELPTVRAVKLLVAQYDRCVCNLRDFRTLHMSLVADYIMAQQRGPPRMSDTVAETTELATEAEDHQVSVKMRLSAAVYRTRKAQLENSAGGKGTGGTDLMNFLRPIRDDCKASILSGAAPLPVRSTAELARSSSSNGGSVALPIAPTSAEPDTVISADSSATSATPDSTTAEVYYKDNGSCADIDLYRGASGVTRTCLTSTGIGCAPDCTTASAISPAVSGPVV